MTILHIWCILPSLSLFERNLTILNCICCYLLLLLLLLFLLGEMELENLVDSVLSLHLFMNSRDQKWVSRFQGKCLFMHWAILPAISVILNCPMTDTQLCPLNFVWPASPGPPAVFQAILIQEAKDNTRHKFWDRRYGDIYGKVHQEDEYPQLKCHRYTDFLLSQ